MNNDVINSSDLNNNNNNNNNNSNNSCDSSNNDDNSKLTTVKKQFLEKEQQRLQSKLEKRQISKEEQIDQSSTTKTSEVLHLINEMSNEIKERLNQINKIDKDKVKSEFESIEDKLSDINSFTTVNSHILTQYDIKSILENIENLRKLIDKSKDINLPKQKFSLTRKKPTSSNKSPISPTIANNNNNDTNITNITTKDEDLKPIFNSGTISNYNNETLYYPPNNNNSDSNINDLLISNLINCKIYLNMKVLTALKINNLINCTIIAYSPIDGSIFIDNCKESTFVLVSRQLRIHYCLNCQFNIFVKSNPIIEGCKEMKFSSFNSYFNQQPQEAQQIDFSRFLNYSFDLETNNVDTDKWKLVNDFDWLQNKPSPNWSIN